MRLLLLLALVAVAATPEETAGRKVFTGKCARCHKLYEPFRYDDKAWESWMTKMRDKAKLNDDQYRQLTAYLETLRASNR
jgi:mono/diheme cytochrome c family protein